MSDNRSTKANGPTRSCGGRVHGIVRRAFEAGADTQGLSSLARVVGDLGLTTVVALAVMVTIGIRATPRFVPRISLSRGTDIAYRRVTSLAFSALALVCGAASEAGRTSGI